jgi:histidinol-phosphate phosphatase family protein
MLAYLLEQCRQSGAREVTLAVGHRAEKVRESLGDEYDGIALRYSVESSPMGTGGAIALAASALGSGPVVILNGDSFTDVNMAAVVARHRARRARATMVLTEVSDGSRFGAVSVAADGRIQDFREKDPANSGPTLINAGIYVVESDFLKGMSTDRHSFERDVLPTLIGDRLFGWRVPGRFIDIGLPETYAMAAEVLRAPPARRSRCGYVVLDRDGTLIEERHYLHKAEDVALLAGAAEGLAEMRAHGAQLVVATNQAGIGRGLYSEVDFATVQARVAELFARHGVVLDASFHCPHHPDAACVCRKPGTGMVEQARRLFGGDAPIAVVGDKACDIELARAVGAAGILVTTGYGAREFAAGLEPDFLVDDLRGAAHVVQELLSQPSITIADACK